MKTYFGVIVLVAALLLVSALSFTNDSRPFAYAAPMPAGITPVGGANPVRGVNGVVIPLVTAAVTADARVCKDMRNARNVDIQTIVSWAATPDIVTIKLQHSNDNVNFTDGPQLVATVIANSSALNRYDQFGAYLCANIDVANPSASNYPNVTILALPHE